MSLDACNGFLEAMAQLNCGCNHAPTYGLFKLPEADSLRESLAGHFSGLHPSEEWEFELLPLENRPDHLRKRLHHWFFEQNYSPKDKSGISHNNAVAGFLDFFLPLIGPNAVGFEVQSHPPDSFWYGCMWEDLAFASETGFWLLHFDFSD